MNFSLHLNSFFSIFQLLKQLKVFWNEKSGFEVNTYFMKEVHTLKSFYKASLPSYIYSSIHTNQPTSPASEFSRWGNITWVKAAGTLKKAKAQMSWKTWNFSLLISLPSECALNQNWVGLDLVGFRVFKNFFLLQKLSILKALKLAMLIAYSDTQCCKF